MKLSQKLLALSGVAVADYACCPYDDYGIPETTCGISEKTPFHGDNWEGNACKAWEGNPDASFDGNDNDCGHSDNWSSCGFQRHFAWVDDLTDVGYSATSTTLNAFGSDFTIGGDDDHYTIGGAPFLGGVCKLWMPVPYDKVLSVNIAGVHLSGTGTSSGIGTYVDQVGSVYCFSVVNPAEFLSNKNNDDIMIHNGNVAGGRANPIVNGGDDMHSDIFDGLTETLRQQGVGHTFYGGSEAPQTPFNFGDAGGDFSGLQNVGPNFDVVAHFDHSWCTDAAHWQREDMQMDGDWGNTEIDYPFGAGDVSEHDHTDTVDKRFSQDLASINDKYACDGTCATNGGMTTGGGSDLFRWPNAGAFAGFYSFVACANADSDASYDILNQYKYVFQNYVMAGDCASATIAAGNDGEACIVTRTVVVSLANDDFRVEDCVDGENRTLKSRFNVRQAGKNIRNCGPGTLPDGDQARCSWNWNFNDFTAGGDTFDEAEEFFGRSSPRDFEPWQSGAAVPARSDQEGSPTSPIQNVAITVTLTDVNADPAAGELVVELPTAYVNGEAYDDTTGVHTFNLICTGNGARDTFPDCFQGEEIHYEWTSDDQAGELKRINPWATVVTADFDATI